jgi:uncharacterized phosphosugar-binding protein
VSLPYLPVAREILDRIDATQQDNIAQAAELFATTIAGGGLVHLFGAGHSRMAVEELFPRIGSIVGFHPIVELSLSYYTNVDGTMGLRQALFLERVEGFGEVLLANYDFEPGDSALVVSSTGINPVGIDVALGFQQRGVPVAAITSVAHSSQAESRHSSGRRLYEVVDITIDNCTPPGDAAVAVAGLPHPVAATSTLATTAILHALNVLVAEKLVARGAPPVVLGSPHMTSSGQGSNLEEYLAAYRSRLKRDTAP